MSKLPLTISTWEYDRTRALIDGRVRVEGCDVEYFPMGPEETFWRAFANREFDVTELSSSSYMIALSRGGCGYRAIPVFLSRSFRHSAIYIRTDRGINKPEDLKGKVVGVPEYQMTAAVWVRGALEDEYGVKARDIRWRNGGLEEPGRHEKLDLNLPKDISLEPAPEGRALSEMLAAGDLDALVTPRAPSCFVEGAPKVARLFPDFRSAEKVFFSKHGIFPIMHLVAIREELVDAHPWLAASVYKAFNEAKKACIPDLEEVAALKVMLPWLVAELEETRKLMGFDYWPYGVAENRKPLEAAVRYSHDQGLSARPLSVEELFVPSTLETAKI